MSYLFTPNASFDPRMVDYLDEYDNFAANRFFITRFGVPSSSMSINLPVGEARIDRRRLRKVLGITHDDARILWRSWNIKDYNSDETDSDYVDEYFVVEEQSPYCTEISVNRSSASIKFLYDKGCPGLEQRLLVQLQTLRRAFTREDKPVFRVLFVQEGRFSTRQVDINPVAVDIERHYNDDFAPVDKTIRAAFGEEVSGLMLLHGLPGTGKTSYIKSLIADFPGQKLIFIPNDFVQHMLEPGFIGFLLEQKNAILVIEDAEKVIMSRTDSGRNSVVSTILQITDGLFSDFLNIKIVCTFNTDVHRIDKALFRKGRMIAFYEFGELTETKARALLPAGADLPATLTLAELFNSEGNNFAEEVTSRRIGF